MATIEGSPFVTRAEWGARPPRFWARFTPSFGSTAHWEGPKIGTFPHSSCASKVRGIQNFHMDNPDRRWSDVAYTAIVCPHGYVYECRWLGRKTGANGTNIGNSSAYAVCYLGGQGDGYTAEGDRAMHDTFTYLRRHGGAGPEVNCHRDWKATACPGDRICGVVKSRRYHTPRTTTAPQEDLDVLNNEDKKWLRALATEIAGTRVAVDQFNQQGHRRDVWRWSGEAVTLLRQQSVGRIVAGVLAGIEAGDVEEAVLRRAVKDGVDDAMREAFGD